MNPTEHPTAGTRSPVASGSFDPLLQELSHHPLVGPERAEIAVEVMLYCVVRRLPHDEAKALLDELPETMAERLKSEMWEPDRSIDRAYLVDELARRLDLDSSGAEAVAQKSASTLREHASRSDPSELARGLRAVLADSGTS